MLEAFGLKQVAYTYRDKAGKLCEASCPARDADHARRFAVAWCDLYGYELVSIEGEEDRAAAARDRDTCILSAPPGTAPAREIKDEDRQPIQQPGLF